MPSRPFRLPGHPQLAALSLLVALAAGTAHAADFDGNGIDDLLFRDRTHGDHRLALVLGEPGAALGGTRASLLLSTHTRRSRGFDVRVADFDGDGRSDVLDRNLASGRIRVRLMNGTRVRKSGFLEVPALATELVAVADFTGEGRADLLLRDPASGTWYLHASDGVVADPAASGATGFARDPAWRLVASADFDADGRTDLLLRNAATLAWRILLLDGPRVKWSVTPDFLPFDTNWQLEGVADLNGDRRADLLLRNHASGEWRAWHLDGTLALPSSGNVAIAPGLVWQLQQLGDLNADNSPDAMLHRFDTGEWRVDLLVGGARIAGSGTVALDPAPGARVAGSGDFDGDGERELLVSGPEGWMLLAARDAATPVLRRLEIPPPRDWPLACPPPAYQRFDTPSKPIEAGADTAFLTWMQPATRENGEALCAHELSGYRIVYQREGNGFQRVTQIDNPRADHKLIGSLRPGTWTFRIFAVDGNGYSSQSSEGISKAIP